MAPDRDHLEVEIGTQSDGKDYAVIRDRVRYRAWDGVGDSAGTAATEALKKFLAHRTAPEYIGE